MGLLLLAHLVAAVLAPLLVRWWGRSAYYVLALVPAAGFGLGGDWFDAFVLPDDRLGIVMGDVTGSGLGAAVVMGRLRSALRAYAIDTASPAEARARVGRSTRRRIRVS